MLSLTLQKVDFDRAPLILHLSKHPYGDDAGSGEACREIIDGSIAGGLFFESKRQF